MGGRLGEEDQAVGKISNCARRKYDIVSSKNARISKRPYDNVDKILPVLMCVITAER